MAGAAYASALRAKQNNVQQLKEEFQKLKAQGEPPMSNPDGDSQEIKMVLVTFFATDATDMNLCR